VVNLAAALPEEAWKPLERLPRYEIASAGRCKPERVKESIGGVEEWRGGDVCAAPFPLPAHQTGRADFPHPASGPR